jgi:N utilization substance protein B
MKRKNDPRHQSRIVALQKLFSIHFSPETQGVDSSDIKEIAQAAEIADYDENLATKIINGVEKNKKELDEIIEKYAPQWPIDQIQKVDIEILRIAIWEGFLSKLTPPKVSIDEGIEIAKEFGGPKSSKFINGVLGSIYEKKEKEKKEDDNDKE